MMFTNINWNKFICENMDYCFTDNKKFRLTTGFRKPRTRRGELRSIVTKMPLRATVETSQSFAYECQRFVLPKKTEIKELWTIRGC